MIPITSPTLVLNEETALLNISNMAAKAKDAQVEFRPHFKTHQSCEIGEWFRMQGVAGITVSSVHMAAYFADCGWRSITIAFPFNMLEHKVLDELAAFCDIRILVDNLFTVNYLRKVLSNTVGVYIELDTGQHRSGVPADNMAQIGQLKTAIEDAGPLSFSGFYTHSGHTYKCRNSGEVKHAAEQVLDVLKAVRREYDAPICFGDTPSCSILDTFGPVSQISPGNFIFYDWMQTQIGACSASDIAVALFCPVVAKHETRKEILIHGGAVHLSKEFLPDDGGKPYYGVIAQREGNSWGEIIPSCKVVSLSQEHGIVACSSEYYKQVNIGDVIPIIPVHSCLTADLMGAYQSTTGAKIPHLSGLKPK